MNNKLRRKSICVISRYFDRFPFDWKNPYGFLISISIEHIMITYALIIGVCALNFSIETYLFVMATTKVIKQNLNSINENDKTNQTRTSISTQFSQFVRYHSMVKQLSTQ